MLFGADDGMDDETTRSAMERTLDGDVDSGPGVPGNAKSDAAESEVVKNRNLFGGKM